MKTELVSVDDLKKPTWHSNYILRPDLVVLSSSICKYGILSPLVVNSENLIIDGLLLNEFFVFDVSGFITEFK
jgi:hypothetical protein